MKKLLLISLLLVVLAAFFASTHPDGLDKTAEKLGFAGKGTERHSLFTGYAVPFLPEGVISTALAGTAGVMIVAGLFFLSAKYLRG